MKTQTHPPSPCTIDALSRRSLPLLTLLVLTVCCALVAHATPTTAVQAKVAVQQWLAQDPTPLLTAMSPTVANITTYCGNGTTPLYYAVALTPGGFVLVSADDQIEPIIAFSPSGSYDPSPKYTLGALVSRDLPLRMAQVNNTTATARTAALTAQQKWHGLLSRRTSISGKVGQVSDPRVDPFVQSLWSQQTIETPAVACYNYYTPGGAGPGDPNNYPSGCGPTAAAQLMRFWQYPTVGVGTASYQITVDDDYGDQSTYNVHLRGGNGNGGPYQWSNMPYDPEASHASVTQCQAIGALCMDAGAAMSAEYSSSGTGVYMTDVSTALSNTFMYANVMLAENPTSSSGFSPEVPLNALYTMVNANLDAGFPVLFGIDNPSMMEGHVIVCDGYGYDAATMYHHLNLGWGGFANAWYNLPAIDTTADIGFPFTVVDSCIYNVYPAGSGEIISGRVLDSNGSPVAGATVTALGDGHTYTATTNARGIYSFVKMPSATTFTLTAAKVGFPTQTIIASTGTSISANVNSSSIACGNVWGADFCSPQLKVLASCSPLASPGATVTYMLTCWNSDGLAATNLRISDVLPGQLTYLTGSASANGSYTAATNTLSWLLGAMPTGQSRTVTFQATINAQTPIGTQITDTACASYSESTTPALNNTAVLMITNTAQSDWWMFHHDQWHLGLSPHFGPATANLHWACNAYDSVNSSPALGADGTIYVGSYDHNLYAIHPDGSLAWTFPTITDIDSSPAVGADGTIYVGSDDGNLYAVNPDGSQKWVFATDDWVYSSPALGSDGTIYVGSLDGNLYAINPDGSERWAFSTRNWVISSPAIGSDGTIYVGSDDYNLYAINPDGTEKWAFMTMWPVCSSPAIGLDGTIYVGSFDYNLYAINPNGSEKWAFTTGNCVYSTPAIGGDGTIYFGSDDDNVYAVSPQGAQLWSFSTENIVASSPAIGADGTIYIGSAG